MDINVGEEVRVKNKWHTSENADASDMETCAGKIDEQFVIEQFLGFGYFTFI